MSRRSRPPALARASDVHLSAHAAHAHASLIVLWLTAPLPALGSVPSHPRLCHPSQSRRPAPRLAA